MAHKRRNTIWFLAHIQRHLKINLIKNEDKNYTLTHICWKGWVVGWYYWSSTRFDVGARLNPILQFINIQFISSNYYDLNEKVLLLARGKFSNIRNPKHTSTATLIHRPDIWGIFLKYFQYQFCCKNSLVIILHDSQSIIMDCKKWICWLFEIIKVVFFPSHTN